MITLNVPKWLLIIFGIIFLFLALYLPIHINELREYGGGGVDAVFTPGPESLKESLNFLLATFSILSSLGVAFILFSLSRNVGSRPFLLFLGTLTFIVFCVGIVLSLYFSILRPLTGSAPTPQDIYCSLRILLVGLALVMFTFARSVS